MNPTRLIALVLLTAGIAALAYGGFSYTRNTQQAKLGPLELSVRETERVNIPVWAGLGAVVAGLGLLTLRRQAATALAWRLLEQTVGFCPHHCVAFATQLLEARPVKHGDMPSTVGNHPKPLQLPGRIGHAFAPHAEHVGD
jgi:hypothetical protein